MQDGRAVIHLERIRRCLPVCNDSYGEHRGEVLYSYFKTDIKLGFPALIYGTFELTSDRNSLQKHSPINQQLIPLLADFMVQTAVDISKEQKECDYRPLRLVIASDMDIVLKNHYKLDVLLREKARKKEILPTAANKYISINDAPKYSAIPFSSILNPNIFSTLLKAADSDDIEEYLESDLAIGFYDYDEFCLLLNDDIQHYTLNEKVELIALIHQEYPQYRISGKRDFPHLMVDSNGNSICDSAKVYPLPTAEQV